MYVITCPVFHEAFQKLCGTWYLFPHSVKGHDIFLLWLLCQWVCEKISQSFLVYVLLTYLYCVCFGLVDFASFFLSFFLFCCCQAHHILVFIHIACIHPITMHSLTDSYLFAWLCSCHIHCICGYWIMDHAHDSFIEYQGFIHTGFVQKNPFKIHKLFTNLCNMGQKNNTKVRNSAAYRKGAQPLL